MRKGWKRFGWLASLAAAWGMHGTSAADGADGPFRRLTNLFGGREAEAPARPAAPGVQDGNRLTEILIELAWLEDPVTFPYYLEARVRSGKLYLRGYVPTAQVHQHAVQVARRHTSLPVEDGFREHPSLTVRQTKRTASQLAEGVKITMERTMPKRASALKIQCTADGNVILQGTVANFEEKLALSQALRRQPGCFRVTNQTQVLGVDAVPGTPVPTPDPVATVPPRPRTSVPPAPAPTVPAPTARTEPGSAPGVAKQPPRQGFFQRLFDGKSKEPAPVRPVSRNDQNDGRRGNLPTLPNPPQPAAKLPVGPNLPATPPAPVTVGTTPIDKGPQVGANVPAAVNQGPLLPPAQVKQVLQRKVQGLGPVRIQQGQDGKLRIETQVRNQQELETLAGRILGLPELAPYGENVELHFTVESPKGP